MKTGIVIYSKSVTAMSRFYEQVLGLSVKELESGYALLCSDAFELVLLETETSQLSVVNKPRESTPLKPVFFIASSYENCATKIVQNGGELYPLKDWEFGGRQVCDGIDCEGNIFQLRIESSTE